MEAALTTARETGRFIRFRQRELAAMSADERQARITAELRQALRGIPPRDRNDLIRQIEPWFPTELGPKEPVPEKAAAASAVIEFKDLVGLLEMEIETRRPKEREMYRDEVARALGWKAEAPPAPITVNGIIENMERLKWLYLSDPDPVLNPELKSFSLSDLVNFHGWVAKIRLRDEGISDYLRDRFTLVTRNLVLSWGGTQSELKDLEERLEAELPAIIEGPPIIDAFRRSRAEIPKESQALLNLPNRNQRQSIRLNQSLLESAYPAEIKFQTTERELVDSLMEALRPMASRSLSLDVLLYLAADALLELGCLDQFARKVLQGLNPRVFDDVHGTVVNERNSLDILVASLMERGDCGGFALDIRRRTGIIECLLFWYGYAPKESAEHLAGLHPDRFKITADGWFSREEKVDFVESWQKFTGQYQELLEKVGTREVDHFHGGDQVGLEQAIQQMLNKTIERRVTTHLKDAYRWQLKMKKEEESL